MLNDMQPMCVYKQVLHLCMSLLYTRKSGRIGMLHWNCTLEWIFLFGNIHSYCEITNAVVN